MGHKLPAAALASLYGAMIEPARGSGSSGARIFAMIAAAGWAHAWQVEDLIAMTDRRLESWEHRVDIRDIARALDLPLRHVCTRPRARSNSAILTDAWAAADAASLFIALEALGFNIDPSPLVELLRPKVPKRGTIANVDLDLLWYDQNRGKRRIMFERDAPKVPLEGYVDHALRGGYKLAALIAKDGQPVSLTVTGPRYRPPRHPVEVLCPECNVTWFRGDPDSSAMHRSEHKKRMATLAPQPDARVTEEQPFNEHVDRASPEWKHREMYARALAFKREEGYDFVQWSIREDDPDVHGFLFADDAGRIVGACAFRLRQYEGHAERWGLQWVWVARPYRRQGILRTRWASLRERFGDFHIEGPVSDAMQAFARTAGDGHLLTIYDKVAGA